MHPDWNETLAYISFVEEKSSAISPSALAMLREACASRSSTSRPKKIDDARSLLPAASAGLVELRRQFASNVVATNAITLLLEGKAV